MLFPEHSCWNDVESLFSCPDGRHDVVGRRADDAKGRRVALEAPLHEAPVPRLEDVDLHALLRQHVVEHEEADPRDGLVLERRRP